MFKKEKQFLVCIDSDGCAIDAMTIKHQKAFGPMVIKNYNLFDIEEDFLKLWDEINLYCESRGINRFAGLVKSFELIKNRGYDVPEFDKLKLWVAKSDELSERALIKHSEQDPNPQYLKAINWSKLVNKKINQIDGLYGAFDHVKESIAHVSQYADIVIVSSANREAIEKEWTTEGLMPYVKKMYGQEAGSKASILCQLKKNGLYEKHQMIMVGDAFSDEKAAKKADILFYPIIVNREAKSWLDFKDTVSHSFINETYASLHEENYINEFHKILKPIT